MNLICHDISILKHRSKVEDHSTRGPKDRKTGVCVCVGVPEGLTDTKPMRDKP